MKSFAVLGGCFFLLIGAACGGSDAEQEGSLSEPRLPPASMDPAEEVAAAALGTAPGQLVAQLLVGSGAAPSRGTPNLLSAELGVSQTEVNDKLAMAVSRFFGIGTGEPDALTTDRGYRVYYELPQDRSQAFIWAPDSEDIRSEGMSYGMMIALQVGLKEHFDRLWKFSKLQMQYREDTSYTPWRHYFKWQGSIDDTDPDNWQVNYDAATVPAPDGEEYFAAALYLAARRWGSNGAVDYRAEADAIAAAMLNNQRSGRRSPIFDDRNDMVVFVPTAGANTYSDPSYHLPAFYELFATDGPSADAERWLTIAEVSREFFVQSAHDQTGLHPDYANFDGTPNDGTRRHDEFRYDAWRVILNMAVDYAWTGPDERLRTQVEKYHAFFSDHLGDSNVSNSLFELDGSNPSGGGSTALTATLAAGGLASESEFRRQYLQNLWDVGQQSGLYRYYQECVYLLGLLASSGHYGYQW